MSHNIDDAERLVIYRLLSRIDPIKNERLVWTVEQACVTAKKTANRYGVPADATTWIYEIHYPYAPAWTASVRAVWRGNELHRPLSTHVEVVDLDDLDDRLGGQNGVIPLLSDWLLSLPL